MSRVRGGELKRDDLLRAWIGLVMLLALGITGCAPNIKDRATALEVIPAKSDARLVNDVSVTFDTGYGRNLKQGSLWRPVGRIAEGDVYKPVNSVFTVEGAHVHEAYLVVRDGARRRINGLTMIPATFSERCLVPRLSRAL